MHHTLRETACFTCHLASSRHCGVQSHTSDTPSACTRSLPAWALLLASSGRIHASDATAVAPRAADVARVADAALLIAIRARGEDCAVLSPHGRHRLDSRFRRPRHTTAVTRPTRPSSPRSPLTSPTWRTPPCSLTPAPAERIAVLSAHARDATKRRP
jgi:hypothetical protein